MITLDLNILPIRRSNGQESAEMPGLVAVTTPRKPARGREHTSLITYLSISSPSITNADIRQLANETAGMFFQSPGSLTFALRNVANEINNRLLARNLSTTGQGQQVLGLLVLAAIRENQCTLLLSGPAHAVWVTDGRSRHIYEPALSGKGLGAGQSVSTYLSQVELHPQDLLVLCGIFPRDWEADLLNERPPASLDASYRKLTFTKGDLNAVLVQPQNGHGIITILKPQVHPSRQSQPEPLDQTQGRPAPVTSEVTGAETTALPANETYALQDPPAPEPSTISDAELDSLAELGAHLVQPSAYAIPPQPASALPPVTEETRSNGGRGFPDSIPRARTPEPVAPLEQQVEAVGEPAVEQPAEAPRRARRRKRLFRPEAPRQATRQVAKVMVGGIQTGRRMNERLRMFFQGFVPRLLPNADSRKPLVIPGYILFIIAMVIPIVVVTMASMVYFRLGQSLQYDELYAQAVNTRAQAVSETDPARQRDSWQRVLNYLTKADEYRVTPESDALRAEAQANLDQLMGVIRLEFTPAFPTGIGSSGQISRLAASESDLYMLDAESGKILHAAFTGRSLELDKTFDCKPGSYSGYQVGTLIDILALPKVNALNATVMGIDANGNLLYCAPNQVAQAIPLPALPNTNWGKISAMSMDSGNLYVLDTQSRAVWVFIGKDGTFVDTPFFYFGNEIPVNIDSAIDLAVASDDLYMLHADGQLSTCTFSRLSEVPTRCQDPAPRVDNFPAHRDVDIWRMTHFTQMSITNPPNSVILLLDAENQSVFRFSPRSFELQNQISGYAGNDNPFPRRSVSAMTVSPNYVLYLAIGDQVYFATNLP